MPLVPKFTNAKYQRPLLRLDFRADTQTKWWCVLSSLGRGRIVGEHLNWREYFKEILWMLLAKAAFSLFIGAGYLSSGVWTQALIICAPVRSHHQHLPTNDLNKKFSQLYQSSSSKKLQKGTINASSSPGEKCMPHNWLVKWSWTLSFSWYGENFGPKLKW